MVTVVVGSYFEEDHIRRIAAVDERVRVVYRPDLLPPPRWPGDHQGPEGWIRPPEDEREWLSLLSRAEVLYDFDRTHLHDLSTVAPDLRWVQASFAGAGEVAARAGLHESGLHESGLRITTASGVYSGPLAEFVLMAFLAHAKDLDRLRENKRAHRWQQYLAGTLHGKTLCLVGTGSIGRAVAERALAFGMRVVGVKRTVREDDPAREFAGELYPTGRLHDALSGADYVAATLPATPETELLLDRAAIAAMKPGAYFANVGRGRVVDEGSLVEALRSGHLSGAALDVFREEPLPQESPLWDLGNVIVSPHATDMVPELTDRLLADLFRENLRRYLSGKDLLNELDKELLY
ncbi:MAG: D-2-hydroxyacid dehydrogenase [Rubrobacter sp.]|nr:D-2-hydroxyacid dehydrogenase [Rubrobacter sp.]